MVVLSFVSCLILVPSSQYQGEVKSTINNPQLTNKVQLQSWNDSVEILNVPAELRKRISPESPVLGNQANLPSLVAIKIKC